MLVSELREQARQLESSLAREQSELKAERDARFEAQSEVCVSFWCWFCVDDRSNVAC